MTKKTQTKHRVISSREGETLRFTSDEEFLVFREEEKALIKKHQERLRNRHGDWSDSEDCYISIDWAIQDKVPPREGKDQVKWGQLEDWDDAVDPWTDKHGDVNWRGEKLEVRCRREDLPSEPEKTVT